MIDADTIRDRLAAELSIQARIAYTLLLTAALLMTSGVVALALSEPALPLRTTVAFAALAAVGLAWAAFAAWVLRRRRVLLPGHRLLATRLAVIVSSGYAIACVVLGAIQGTTGPFVAAAVGAIQIAVAGVLHHRARLAVDSLRHRRDQLAKEMARRLAATGGADV
jgi:hypothetical protein